MQDELHRSPLCLTVPGLGGSGSDHWQSVWERERGDCERIELGCWDQPIRNVWMSRIDQAVRAAQAPVVLVAHSLGCIAVAWWATLLGEAAGPVRGALLVAPPNLERANRDSRLDGFAPLPRGPLPFPALVVGSTDDPWSTPAATADMATGWLAGLVTLDGAGHVNAASGLGAWGEGQRLLEWLIDGGRPAPAVAVPPAARQAVATPHAAA